MAAFGSLEDRENDTTIGWSTALRKSHFQGKYVEFSVSTYGPT